MTGRRLFRLMEPVFKVGTLCFKILPNFLCKFIWDAISPFSGLVFVSLRYIILNSKANIGKNIYIGTNVIFKNWKNFKCGDNLSIHDLCYIDAYGGITIGNDVSVAHNCSLVSFNHTYQSPEIPIKYNEITSVGIIISNDVWVGCGVRLLDGTNIGNRVIVAAGAVLGREVNSNTMVGGVPAKVIKQI